MPDKHPRWGKGTCFLLLLPCVVLKLLHVPLKLLQESRSMQVVGVRTGVKCRNERVLVGNNVTHMQRIWARRVGSRGIECGLLGSQTGLSCVHAHSSVLIHLLHA